MSKGQYFHHITGGKTKWLSQELSLVGVKLEHELQRSNLDLWMMLVNRFHGRSWVKMIKTVTEHRWWFLVWEGVSGTSWGVRIPLLDATWRRGPLWMGALSGGFVYSTHSSLFTADPTIPTWADNDRLQVVLWSLASFFLSLFPPQWLVVGPAITLWPKPIWAGAKGGTGVKPL